MATLYLLACTMVGHATAAICQKSCGMVKAESGTTETCACATYSDWTCPAAEKMVANPEPGKCRDVIPFVPITKYCCKLEVCNTDLCENEPQEYGPPSDEDRRNHCRWVTSEWHKKTCQ